MCRAQSSLILVLLLALVFVGPVVDSVKAQPAVCPTEPFPVCVLGPGEVCLDLPFIGADSVKIGLAISTESHFCFTADQSGRYDFAAVAYYGDQSLACQLHVDVSFGLPPQVVCPEQPFEIYTCGPGRVCLDVPVSRARTVQTSAGDFNADNFCLQVDTSGVYNITLVAANVCGVDSCSFQVVVTVGEEPIINCPAEPVSVDQCSLEEICIPVDITGADSVTTSAGTWAEGVLCVTPEQFGAFAVEIRAYNECTFAVCNLPVVVTPKPATVLTCAQEPVSFVECGPNMVCVPVSYEGDSVRFSTGEYAEGQLCFHVSVSSIIPVTATAWGPCGTVTCEFTLDVTILGAPTLTCPTDTPLVETCAGLEVCVPLALEPVNADSVRVEGAVWSEGQACFTPSQPGLHTITITAFNRCGVTTCERVVEIAPFLGPAIIECPAEPIAVSQCPLGDVSVPLVITNADYTFIDGASWAENMLTFTATREGAFNFVVEAYGDCGADTCELSVVVSKSQGIYEAPELVFTDTIFFMPRQTYCAEVPMPEGYTITVEGAAWANDTLCFDVDTVGTYRFAVIGESECQRYKQLVSITLDDGCPPNYVCELQDPENWITCVLPDTVCLAIGIDEQYDVLVPDGWYDRDQGKLCFVVDTAGLYTWTFQVGGECGYDECGIGALVQVDPVPTACFTAAVDAQEALTIQFENCSLDQGYFTWQWLFGDGNSVYHPEPSHTYATAGCYEVSLIEYGACGTDTMTDTVCLGGPNFECYPGDAESWFSCKFPDTVRLPLHVDEAYEVNVPGGWYNRAAEQLNFVVDSARLYYWPFTVSNQYGAVECGVAAWVTLEPLPTACFTATADPQEPLTVQFENCSPDQGYFAWQWLFGDGDAVFDWAPTHTYPTAGCYEVRVIEYGACGTDTLTDTLCLSGNQIVQPTPVWLSLYCAGPSLDGVPLQIGDVIEVYDNNGVLCGLGAVEPHGYGFMPVYADDAFSMIDEGADAGTPLSFRVNGQAVYANPPVIWTAMGDRIPVCTFTTANCVRIPIQTNWNLVSWDVAYSGPIANALAPLSGCIEVVLGWDGRGLSWDPVLTQYSTLDQVDYHAGYWIKATCDTALTICAPPINPDDYIPLAPGWNLVSFWREYMAPYPTVEAGFASILDDLDLAYTYANGYQIWKPGQAGGLSNLAPLAGYWLKMSAGDNLAYPGFGAGPMNPPPQSGPGGVVATSTNWISVYANNLKVDGVPVTMGRAIAFWFEGTLCGLASYNGSSLDFTPVYGADSDAGTANLPGPGDKVQIQVGTNYVSPLLTWSNSGDRIMLGDLSTGVSADEDENRPMSFALDQNYPNPFNPSTNIAFSLHTSGPTKLELFNIRGELVRTLIDRPMGSGEHTIVWDGADNDGRSVAGGVYLYRLTAGARTESRKMVLIK